MKTFICITLLLAAGFGHCLDTNLHESEKVFESQFKKIYIDKESEQRAAAALTESEIEINEQNKLFLEGKSSFTEKLNELSDMPRDLFKKEKEGQINIRPTGYFNLDPSEWYTHPDLKEVYESRQALPASFDARSKGLVTSVKNQMNCGSCSAFAATGAHETCMLSAGGRFNGLDLSEQQLIDCGYDGKAMIGCDGADALSYGVFFAKSLKGQSAHEVSYPYLDDQPNLSCPSGLKNYNSGAFVSKAMPDYRCTEEKLKRLVATYGAAVATIYASDRSLGNFDTTVYSKCTSNETDHAILVVGYGTDPVSKMDYWLIKNSWGTNWGKNGYLVLQRGVGMCGIGTVCHAAQCSKTTGSLSDPPIPPPPAPVPVSQVCDISSLAGPITGTGYTITFGDIVSEVNCVNGVCEPATAGPSNACMYICGKLQCKK